MNAKNFYKKISARHSLVFYCIGAYCLPGSDMPKVGWLDKIYFDKWVHIGMFGVLTFLFCCPFYKSDLSMAKKLIIL